MKKLWNLVDRTSWMTERKYRVCMWVLAVIGALLGAVLWQKEVMPVDTHVFRVSERIGLTTRSKTPLQTELTLEKNIPGHLLPLAHHWLILHGRYVCVARAPKCDECGIATWCRKYASDHRQPKTLKI